MYPMMGLDPENFRLMERQRLKEIYQEIDAIRLAQEVSQSSQAAPPLLSRRLFGWIGRLFAAIRALPRSVQSAPKRALLQRER